MLGPAAIYEALNSFPMQSSSQRQDNAIFRKLIKVWCRQLSCPLMKKPQREREGAADFSPPSTVPCQVSCPFHWTPSDREPQQSRPGTGGKCPFLAPLPSCPLPREWQTLPSPVGGTRLRSSCLRLAAGALRSLAVVARQGRSRSGQTWGRGGC